MSGASSSAMVSILHIQSATSACEFVDRWLGDAGYLLHTESAATAKDYLERSTPDLIISEAVEASQALKLDLRTSAIPVLQLLAAEPQQRLTLHVADAYLAQPIQDCELLSMVQILLSAQRMEHTYAHALLQWERTFDAMADAVLVLDSDRHVIGCNQAMCALFERDARDPRDRPLSDLLWYQVRGLLDGARRRAQQAHREADISLLGSHYHVVIEQTPAADDVPLTVMTLNDITESKHLEQGYQDAAHRLVLDAQRKDEFLAMLAHELRNPLNAIVAANRLLASHTAISTEDAHLVSVVDRQSRHLSRLIDELLDVSRITRGEITLHRERIDLREVVARAHEGQRGLLEARAQHVALELPERPVLIDGDELRLEQAIANLLANASKYSGHGATIELSLRLPRGEAAGHAPCAVLTLTDSGIGIPRDMLDAVFEMFVQVDRSLDRRLGGLGLGLTLVKQIVEGHGGSVRAHSHGLGTGAKFVVQLPLSEAQPVRAANPTAKLPAGMRRPRQGHGSSALEVLVIEDNDDTRELMCSLLEHRGHRVLCAADGVQGLVLATEQEPEVALIDIGLPGMNGYAVARQLRETEWVAAAPFLVALTGYGSPADHARTTEAGFDAHMVKPVDTSRLFELLQKVAEHRRDSSV